MKRIIAIVLTLVMILAMLAGCKAPEPASAPAETEAAVQKNENSTVVFTDSVGREVEVPANITKIAISGPLAQIVVFALAPDKLVGISTPWDKSAEEFLDTQ